MQIALLPNLPSEEADEISCHSAVVSTEAVVPLDRFSSSMRFKRVMSWMMRFLHNCRAQVRIEMLNKHALEFLNKHALECKTNALDFSMFYTLKQ